jgi:hypothetical protein
MGIIFRWLIGDCQSRIEDGSHKMLLNLLGNDSTQGPSGLLALARE